MKLVSDHVVEGRPGPGFAQTYPTLAGVDLADIWRFRDGQPWADFARMRAEAPVMWHPEPGDHPGFWALTRYADVRAVNGDPETFSSEVGGS
jgi:cytochrome P450